MLLLCSYTTRHLNDVSSESAGLSGSWLTRMGNILSFALRLVGLLSSQNHFIIFFFPFYNPLNLGIQTRAVTLFTHSQKISAFCCSLRHHKHVFLRLAPVPSRNVWTPPCEPTAPRRIKECHFISALINSRLKDYIPVMG